MLFAGTASVAPLDAVQPPPGRSLAGREFARPDLRLPSDSARLGDLAMSAERTAAWRILLATWVVPAPADAVFVDPRSGAALRVVGAFPLLPGTGVGNDVTLADVGARLGRPVDALVPALVADLARAFVARHALALGLDPAQLGVARAAEVTSELWQVSIQQTYAGLPVRHGRLAASIKHGNLVVIGSESWGDVRGLDSEPRLDAETALDLAFDWLGGRSLADVIEQQPRLEVLPVAASEGDTARAGYAHRLVWSLVFRREPEAPRWEALVDAHTGDVLSFQDVNHYVKRHVTGGVYTATNTDVCPDAARCGVMQLGWPMPFANTGVAAAPFADSAGVYDYTSGVATTSLSGPYAFVNDGCGALSLSSGTGVLSLGGSPGQHDCTTPGVGGPGNTAAARTAYYEANKLFEIGRGWLPGNTWLQGGAGALRLNTNTALSCAGQYANNAISVSRAGSGCVNVGEIPSVIAHEWGHGLDDFDANGIFSNTSEAYADVTAMYRTQSSCVGYGFYRTINNGCGTTSDGTGFNCKEGTRCCLDCSGVRESDYARFSGAPTPVTPQNFVCPSCASSTGPCGRQVHCASAVSRQAAWDLPARDLQAAPFAFDRQTAFIVASKLFYQGSGNIGLWHACNCTAGTSDGCGATHAYTQWLVADDDNGNLLDGTPHMTALAAAFGRHNIACPTPAPVNSGCAGGPATAPALTAAAGVYQVSLSWTAVPGATRYWVFRTEGVAGCDSGKALIAEVTGLTHVDTQVLPCRSYTYNVVAAGASSACFSRASACRSARPANTPGVLCPALQPAGDLDTDREP
jgi:hypothetical protein